MRKTLNIFKFTVIRVLFATLILVSIKTYGYTDTLSVGVYQNNPKVFIDNDGVAKGIFVDIIEEIAKRENWHIKYVYGSWIDNIERLKEGKIDILLDVSYSESRAKQFLFNNIFVIDTWLEVYMLSGSTINSITDLSGKRIAVIEGSVQHEYLVNEFNGVWDISFTLQVYPDYKSSTQALLLGQSDAMLTSRFFYFSENKHKDIVPVPIILRPSQIYFAFPKNQNLEIVNAIDKRLVQLKNNPKSVYYKSLNKWLKHYNTRNFLDQYKILGLSFIALILLLFSFIVILRKRVKISTKQLRRKNKQLNETNKQLSLLLEKHKAIEEDLLQFRFMVENARQEAYLINPDGTIEYFNKSVEKNLGYSLKDLYGKNLNVLDPIYGNKFHQHYLELKKHFTKYALAEFLALPSTYSQRIYEILRSWDDCDTTDINMEDLHEMLQTPPSMRKNSAEFKRRVLDKAKKDIEEKTTLRFSYEISKKGRKAVSVRFSFGRKSRAKAETKAKKADQQKQSTNNNALFLAAVQCAANHPDGCGQLRGTQECCKACMEPKEKK